MTLHTSTSATQDFLTCPRKRYIKWHYPNPSGEFVGITSATQSIPLTTGIFAHQGIANILSQLKATNGQLVKSDSMLVDGVVAKTVSEYKESVKTGLTEGTLVGGNVDSSWLDYVIAEQSALIEALIRVWVLRELPRLLRRFRIWSVEQEITRNLSPDIIIQTRVDAILQELEGNDLYVYSLKAVKSLDSRSERSYRRDLQSINDIIGIESYLRDRSQRINLTIESLDGLEEFAKIRTYLKSKQVDRVSGVVFCYLLKGRRVQLNSDAAEWEDINVEEKDKQYITRSPLIRGFKRPKMTMVGHQDSGFAQLEWTYAHSDKRLEPNNKSGFGKLPKKEGWEKVDIWNEMPISAWIDMLDRGEVQEELGDVLSQIVVTPMDYFRYEPEIESRGRQIERIENVIRFNLAGLTGCTTVSHPLIDEMFPQNSGSCEYPYACEFKPICWGEDWKGSQVSKEVQDDPVGSGWYRWREPHHKAEKLYQIKESGQ